MTNNEGPRRQRMRMGHSVEHPTYAQMQARRNWVALLRSGKYEQMTGALCSGDGTQRCCLGVAADPSIHGINLASTISRQLVQGKWTVVREFIYADSFKQSGRAHEYTVLPIPLQAALGFMTDDIDVWTDDGPENVAGLNDRGMPFEQIADLIEDDYIKPFEG